MANIKSALKRIRSSARKRARNKPIDSALKTFVKSAHVQIAATGNDSADAVMRAVSALDKAVSKGIIHKNQAARRKSRLMAKLNTAPSREETMAAAAASTARPSRRKSQ